MSRDKETKKQTDRPGPRGDPTRGGSPKNCFGYSFHREKYYFIRIVMLSPTSDIDNSTLIKG